MKQGTLEKIQNLAVSLQLVTVEDMRKHSLPQLVTMIANKLNELMNEVHRFETDVIVMVETQNENIQYLLGEGLHLEVATVFERWVEDGTFDTLINQTALKKVNERIDETNAHLSQVNNLKVGNGVLASMSDLGQDVKEAMIGGGANVPIVGVGAVNHLNINTKQITADKLTDTITINVGDLPVYQANAVINPNGSISNSSSYNVVEYVMPDEINSVQFVGTETLHPNGFIYYDDDTASIGGINFSTRCPHRCSIRLNYSPSIPQGVKKLILKAHTKGQISENEFDVIGGDNLYDGTGYIANNNINPTPSFSVYKVKIHQDFRYKATLSALDGLKGCAYDSSNKYLGNISVDGGYLKKIPHMDYILINITDGDKLIAERITTNQPSVKYSNFLNKPYTFNGKKAYFFGDSITEGFTSGSTKTTNGYPKLFSEKVGMAYSNFGIGGALFTSGYNEIETIPTTIKKKSFDGVDFAFIAGGTNDFGLGASLSGFRETLVDLCTWLKVNAHTTEIIFILPINRVRDADVKEAELQDFRNIIGEVAIMNGFSVLDGSLFNFPTDDGELQKLLMPDKLHPSEFGYSVYAKGMCTYLC